jgi:hypothetical protein
MANGSSHREGTHGHAESGVAGANEGFVERNVGLKFVNRPAQAPELLFVQNSFLFMKKCMHPLVNLPSIESIQVKPKIDGSVIKGQTPFRHHFLKIAVTERIW